MEIIRKISVGTDYPRGCMHIQVGKEFDFSGSTYTVCNIKLEEESDGSKVYRVYLETNGVKVLWKEIMGMPVVVETKIDFE